MPGHERVTGNEMIDELAETGAETTFIGPESASYGLPKSYSK